MLQATLTGNLGNDPDMRYSANGNAVLRFNVASNARTRNADGEWVDEVAWVRVTVAGQRAESLAQYLKKGSRVCVVGRLDARPWTDQQGQLRAGLELFAAELDFMSPRQDDGNGQQPAQQQQRQAPQQNRPPQQRQAPSGRQMPEGMAVHGGQRGPQQRGMDDSELQDLPF